MFSQICIYEIVAGVSVVSWFLSSKMNGFSQETDNLGSFSNKATEAKHSKTNTPKKGFSGCSKVQRNTSSLCCNEEVIMNNY